MATSEPSREDFSFADGKDLRLGLARDAGDRAARIADGAGAGKLEGGLHHVGQLVFVFGRHENHLGNAAQIGDVEEAVMRGAVVAGEAGAVHAEEHGQLLQADVVDDGIEGALQECGIDGADGTKAARGHAGGEDDGVLLGDAHVEVALGMVRAEEIEAGAVGHGGGDGDDAVVLVGQLDEGVGEDFGVGGLAGGLGLAGFGIVGAEAVKFLLPVERGLKAAALLREDVQQDGAIFGLEELEGLDQQRKVVAVDGAEVLQAELLKEDGGPEHALGGFFGAAHHVDGGFAAEASRRGARPTRGRCW